MWKWLWNKVEAGRVLRCILEKAKTALKKYVKGDCGENSDVNEEHALGKREKMILLIKWQRIWLNCVVEFSGRACKWWNVKLASGCLGEEISNQIVEGVAWLLLIRPSPSRLNRMQEERDKLKESLRKRKRERTWRFGKILSLSILQKNERACPGENTKGVAGQWLHEEITPGVTIQPNQQKLGTEMGLYQQRLWPFGPNRTVRMK